MAENTNTPKSPLLKGGADEVGGGFPEVSSRLFPRNKNLKLPARELRKNATKQENHLWYDFLRKFKPQFLRQYVIHNFIINFYCPKTALSIEIDGSQHYEHESIKYDKARTEYLNGLGIEVLRFANIEIDKNFTSVCEKIQAAVEHRTRKSPVTS